MAVLMFIERLRLLRPTSTGAPVWALSATGAICTATSAELSVAAAAPANPVTIWASCTADAISAAIPTELSLATAAPAEPASIYAIYTSVCTISFSRKLHIRRLL